MTQSPPGDPRPQLRHRPRPRVLTRTPPRRGGAARSAGRSRDPVQGPRVCLTGRLGDVRSGSCRCVLHDHVSRRYGYNVTKPQFRAGRGNTIVPRAPVCRLRREGRRWVPAPHAPARPSPATHRQARAVTPQGPARKLLRARPPPRLAVRLRRARELGRAREARRADSRVSVASFRSRVTRRRPAGPSRAHPSFRGPLPRLERSTRHCARDLVTPGRGASQAPASQGSQPRGPGRLADPTGHGVRLAHPDARPFVGDRDQEEPHPAPAVCGCRPHPGPVHPSASKVAAFPLGVRRLGKASSQ